MDSDDVYELRWNDHQSTLSNVADCLLSNGAFVDCALVAEGRCIDVHKIVLYACSPYFRTILNHPTNGRQQAYSFIILNNVSFENVSRIVDYMYKGVVRMPFTHISEFAAAADWLQITGLTTPCQTSAPSKPESPQPTQTTEFLGPPQLTPETYPESKTVPSTTLPESSPHATASTSREQVFALTSDLDAANGRQLRKRSHSNWSMYGPTLYQRKQPTKRKKSVPNNSAFNDLSGDTSVSPFSSLTDGTGANLSLTEPMTSERTNTESSTETISTITSSCPAV